MRARTVLPLIMVSMYLLAAPSAGAQRSSFVPELVLDGIVPAYVTDVGAGTRATLAIGPLSASKTATVAGNLVVKLAGVQGGLQEWTLTVAEGNKTSTTTGFVLVDESFVALRAQWVLQQGTQPQSIANLTAALDAWRTRDSSGSDPAMANLTTRIDALARLVQSNVLPNPRSAAPVLMTTSTTPYVSGWTLAASLGLLGLLLVPLNVWLVWQARKNRRESLLLLLMLAAKAGITPDSPEFQNAMAAFDGRRAKEVEFQDAVGNGFSR